jgi:hypothetical protein
MIFVSDPMMTRTLPARSSPVRSTDGSGIRERESDCSSSNGLPSHAWSAHFLPKNRAAIAARRWCVTGD